LLTAFPLGLFIFLAIIIVEVMMGRPPKPTQVLEMSGAFKKNPQRKKARATEPVIDTLLGKPPGYFTDEQRAAWVEIVQCAAEGVLTGSDSVIVEMAARELVNYRTGFCNSSDKMLLMSILARLGFSPADRSKVQIPQKAQQSKWSRHAK
jgi:hypothetical protein